MTKNMTLIRGGKATWHIDADIPYIGQDLDDLIVSITGLTKAVTFDGELQGCQPIIVLQRTPETEAIENGTGLVISLNGENLWSGNVIDVRLTENEITLTAAAALTTFDKNFHIYYPRGSSVRWLLDQIYRAWGLLPGTVDAVPAFSDSYNRSCGRISTKFSTLGGLTGVASYGTVSYYGWMNAPGTGWANITDDAGNIIGKRIPENSTTLLGTNYTISKTGTSKPACWDISWAVGDDNGARGCIQTNPLSLHGVNIKFMLRNVWKYTDLAQQTLDHWPVGEMRNRSTMLYIKNSSTYYPLLPRMEEAGDKTSEEFTLISYNKWGGEKKREKVILDNINTVSLSAALWSEEAQTSLGQSWTIPSGTLRKNSWILPTTGCFSKGSTGDPTGRYNTPPVRSFLGTITFNSQDMSEDLSGSSFLNSSFYAIETRQDVQPITINAEEFTYDKYGKEILELGSVGYYESSSGWYGPNTKWADTCPESGTVFEIPLNDDFVVDFEFDAYHWLPKAVKLDVRDMFGNDYAIETPFENDDANPTDTKEYHWIQSQLWHRSHAWNNRANVAMGERSYRLYSDTWDGNAGFPFDRWTGCSSPNSTSLTPVYLDDAYTYGEYLVLQNGEQRKVAKNLGIYSGFNSTTNYKWVERDGSERRWFYGGTSDAQVVMAGGPNREPNILPDQDAPYVDIFTLKSMQLAVHRAFADYRRPTYRVTTSLAFATAEPGAIIYLKTNAYDNNTAWLALLMSITVNADSGNCTLLIAPLRTVASIPSGSTAWTNLDYIKAIDIHNSETSKISPFVRYNNQEISKEWQYEAHYTIGTEGLSWTTEDWFHELVQTGSGTPAYVQGNSKSPFKITLINHVTGYRSDFLFTESDWTTVGLNRQAQIGRFNKAILGDDFTGNGFTLYQKFANTSSFSFVFQTYEMPDLCGWEFIFYWNDPVEAHYTGVVEYPANLWQHSNAYMSTSYLYDNFELCEDLPDYSQYKLVFTDADGNRTEFAANRFSAATSTTGSNYYYFAQPTDGVFTEIRLLVSTYYRDTNIRCTIGYAYRAGFPSNSTFASTYFDDSYQLKDGCSIAVERTV